MNRTFKDILKNDLNVFMNSNEFADHVEFDGKNILAVRDDDIYEKRNQVEINYAGDGIFKDVVTLFIRHSELEYKPVKGQEVTLNGEYYTVKNCRDDFGIYKVELEANIG